MNEHCTHSGEHPCGRRLYQDRENGIISGVCAGIAEFFAFNVTAVRLAALVSLFFFSLLTLAVYFILAFLLRDKPLRYRGRRPETEFWRSADRGRRPGRQGQ